MKSAETHSGFFLLVLDGFFNIESEIFDHSVNFKQKSPKKIIACLSQIKVTFLIGWGLFYMSFEES